MGKFVRNLVLAAALAALPAAAAAQDTPAAARPHLEAMKRHVVKAEELGGDEFGFLANMLCLNASTGGDYVGQFWGSQYMRAADQDFEPVRVFDNFHFVGLRQNGAWAITTSEGIILLDSLDYGETESRLIPNMRKAGLDPAQIKYVIVGHAHSDHMGGAKYLQEKYGAKVVMSPEDWVFAEGAKDERSRAYLPRRDVVAPDGHQITLGDTTVTIYFTPGHTPGAISAIFPVREGGTVHKAAWWGGPQWGLRNRKLSERDILQRSMTHFRAAGEREKVTVGIEGHPFLSNAISKLAFMRDRKPGTPNPMVIGEAGWSRYFGVWEECARASRARYEANLIIYGPDPRTWPPAINATTAGSARLGVAP
jgi:metallo-beta-lactamase class B